MNNGRSGWYVYAAEHLANGVTRYAATHMTAHREMPLGGVIAGPFPTGEQADADAERRNQPEGADLGEASTEPSSTSRHRPV